MNSLSSMHQDKKIYETTGEDKKPQIITFYFFVLIQLFYAYSKIYDHSMYTQIINIDFFFVLHHIKNVIYNYK